MPDIESLLKEKRVFKPDAAFTRQANWNRKTVDEYRKLGAKNPEKFWAKMAKENVSWFTPWIATSKARTPGAATRRRSSGKANPEIRVFSPTRSCTARCAASRT